MPADAHDRPAGGNIEDMRVSTSDLTDDERRNGLTCAVLVLGGLDELLLAVPAVRAVRDQLPRHRLVLAARPGVGGAGVAWGLAEARSSHRGLPSRRTRRRGPAHRCGWVRGRSCCGDSRPWPSCRCRQVAELCAQALGRAFSYTEQQRARAAAERATARLQALTTLAAELGACTTPEAVGDVLISTARRTIGADAASAMAADASGKLRLLAWSADVEVGDTGLTGLALADLALVREQLATRRPVFVRSEAERELRYPDMSGVAVKQQAWANLPLFVGDRFVGAVAFGWDEIRDFPSDEQEFLTTLARHVAVAPSTAGPWALLLYTDGLVERRSAMLREGMADIARAAPVLRDAPDLDAALGTLVDAAAGHPDRTYDDVAALVLRGGRAG